MRTTLPALVAVILLAGCGTTDEADRAASPPPPPASTGPSEPPPELDQDGPPPAWIETGEGSFWLGYSTYCWDSICADYVGAECGNERFTPSVTVAGGERVTFHLGFEPTSVSLNFHASDGMGMPDFQERLATASDPSWEVSQLGAALLSLRAEGGKDASYAVCFVSEPLTVADALARGEGDAVVEGPLWADGPDVRLCDAVAESYPPQCPSGYIKVRGLDLSTVENLNEASGIRWTDDAIQLTGTLKGDVLHVRG